jgi:hypothetical protein
VHAHAQRLDSAVKMATVLDECSTENQRCVVRFFLWKKGLSAKDIHKEVLRFTKGSVCSIILRLVDIILNVHVNNFLLQKPLKMVPPLETTLRTVPRSSVYSLSVSN